MSLPSRLHQPIRRVLRALSGSKEFYGSTSRYVQFEDESASAVMNSALSSGAPFMAARFGKTELNCIVDYLNSPSWRSIVRFARGEIPHIGWRGDIHTEMEMLSGFFPNDRISLGRFSELMLTDMGELDILGSWLCQEALVQDRFTSAKRIKLRMLEPFWSARPWSAQLKGKRVLVIHPFEATIRHQFSRRRQLFSNPDILPDFELDVIKAVQSIAGNRVGFQTWFDALDYLKSEVSKREFDVALLGCGAYGFPLAAHVKRLGRQSIHLGGATQLLFGIKGSRWESIPTHAALFNDSWIRPLPIDVPQNYKQVEGGSYW